MIRRFFTLLAITWFATAANAQSVQVRTGEHQGFTRIVLTMPGRIAWQLDQSGKDATLVFERPGLTFDTSAVFDRISENRLMAVAADATASKLNLTLGCDCKLKPFWLKDRMLVIDISDDKSATTGIEPDKKPTLRTKPVNQGLNTQVTLQLPGLQSEEFLVRPLDSHIETDPVVETAKGAEQMGLPEIPQDPKHLAETRDRLLRQIGRAATQGLLSPRSGFPGRKTPEKQDGHIKPDESHGEKPQAGIDEKVAQPSSENINLKAQTSIDRDFLRSLVGSSQVMNVSHCLGASQVEVSQWGTTAPFPAQIGVIRTRLTEEFDVINQDAAIELARLYIYFGFGVEARQILALLTDDSPTREVLRDMAMIIEDGHAPAGSVLYGQLECESPAALWSALAHQALPKDIPIETNAVLRAFSALPIHLRRHLGPDLSRRFLQAGYQDVAEKLLRIITRANDGIPHEANILQAELDLAEGDNETAESTLETVVKTNSQPSAEALLRLIENRLKNGGEISFELVQLAGAYALENRGTAIGHDLSLAYISSLASSGAFDQSYMEFDRLKSQLSPQDVRTVQNRVLAILTQNSDELTFLRYAISTNRYSSSALDPDVANAAARRLLAAGFTPAARSLVSATLKGPVGEARQLIRAEISLKEGRPRQAEIDLLGLTSSDANLLRARARSDVGEHTAAFQLYKSVQMDEEAIRSAWLAEDWDQLSKQGDTVLADVARLMQSPPSTPDEDEIEARQITTPDEKPGVLAQNRKLLADSGSSRSTLTALLASKPLPVGLDQ